MSTKILGQHLQAADGQVLLGLAENSRERRILRQLFTYQVKQSHTSGGLAECKFRHNMWLDWITRGMPRSNLMNWRKRHGHKAALQPALRLYYSYKSKDRRVWRDKVTTILRSYQVCGPSIDDMHTAWADTIRPNILNGWEKRHYVSLTAGFAGRKLNSDSSLSAINDCAQSIRQYFDMVERQISKSHQDYSYFTHFELKVRENDVARLFKKGPHRIEGQTETSVFSQALDFPRLQQRVELDTFVDDKWYQAGLKHFPFIVYDEECESILDMLDKLNEAILSSSKQRGYLGYARFRSTAEYTGVPSHGRTVLLQDKAGKTRPISIAPYTVNKTFMPIHNALFEVLLRIPQDSTIQEKGIARIKKWTERRNVYISSVDLSSATDRLPVALQAYVLYRLMRLNNIRDASAISRYWYLVMTSLRFTDPVDQESYFSYAVGQPMGVYTSWPMLSLTNHIMARAAAYVSKEKPRYVVCGDDIVIVGHRTHLRYRDWMNALGVEVNDSKSHTSLPTSKYTVAEFCKRLFVNGQLVSGESPKLLIAAVNDKSLTGDAMELLESLRTRKLSKLELRKLGVYPLFEGSIVAHLPREMGGLGIVDSDSKWKHASEDSYIIRFALRHLKSRITCLQMRYTPGSGSDSEILSTSEKAMTRVDPGDPFVPDWKYISKSASFDTLYRAEELLLPLIDIVNDDTSDIFVVLDSLKETVTRIKALEEQFTVPYSSDKDPSLRKGRTLHRAVKRRNIKIGYQLYTIDCPALDSVTEPEVQTYVLDEILTSINA